MSDPVNHSDSRQPTDQELRNVQVPANHRRIINILSLSFVTAAVVIFGVAIWFFLSENHLIAYVLFAVVIAELGAALYMRRMMTRRAKLMVWSQDPLNQTL